MSDEDSGGELPAGRSHDRGNRMQDEHVRLFEDQRPRLMGICYRILGTIDDAEDALQEAWIRWRGTELNEVQNTEAFLTTIVTRLSLDRLRRVKAQREVYTGSWLPEPVAVDDPQEAVELADSLSPGLLVVLETLSPLERVAFVLREVFQQPYPEVAATLGREEPAVRQLVHRARARVAAGGARYQADRALHAQVVERFLAACQSADVNALLQLLAPDVVVISDGGGVAQAPLQPVHGHQRVARLLMGIAGRVPPGTAFSLEPFNGVLGIVARLNGRTVSAMAVTVDGETVQTLHLIANPAKLTTLDAGHAVPLR